MFGIRTWRALRRRGVMGINQRNGDYVLAYNDRRLYPLVDDKIRTKKLALDAGIQVPDMYGIIDTEQGISKLQHIVETPGGWTDFLRQNPGFLNPPPVGGGGPPKAVEGQVDEVAPLPLRQRFALPPPQDKLGEE